METHKTLRDEIAIAAMCATKGTEPWPTPNSDEHLKQVARDAYRLADAMLRAREEEK